MITHILLDVDGVLANFCEGVGVLFNKTDYEFSDWKFYEEWGLTDEEFWQKIDAAPHFWENLPQYEWFDDILSAVRDTSIPFTLMTSPSFSPNCYYGKRKWIIDRFGSNFTACILGSRKYLLAKPTTVLIDDSNKNCKKFAEHGGRYILFPQPWNKNARLCNDRIKYVTGELALMVRRTKVYFSDLS